MPTHSLPPGQCPVCLPQVLHELMQRFTRWSSQAKKVWTEWRPTPDGLPVGLGRRARVQSVHHFGYRHSITLGQTRALQCAVNAKKKPKPALFSCHTSLSSRRRACLRSSHSYTIRLGFTDKPNAHSKTLGKTHAADSIITSSFTPSP